MAIRDVDGGRMAKQDYPYYRPVWNRSLLLILLPVVLVFTGLGIWMVLACPAPAAGLLLLTGGGLVISASAVSAISTVVRRLERKRLNINLLDQQLLKMSRLAATSKVTRDFLDHVKDVLANIDSAAAWGQTLLDEKNLLGFRENLSQIQSESVRAHKAIENLLSFTRPPENRWLITDVDVNGLLIDMLELFAGEFHSRHIRVQRSFEKRLPAIRSNLSRLYQVLQNILLVIVSDIDSEGGLHITTAAGGDGVRIEMRYPSRHFDENVLRRLSDPAYALQSQEPGPWLALCMYHVDRINARLSAEKTDSQLTFTAVLPYRIDKPSSLPPRSFLKGL